MVKPADLATQLEDLERRSQDLLARLGQLGVDLDAERDIELQFHSPDRARSRKLADALRRKGYRYVFLGSPHPRTGIVSVTVPLVAAPHSVSSPEQVSRLVHLAMRFGAVHDGWVTST